MLQHLSYGDSERNYGRVDYEGRFYAALPIVSESETVRRPCGHMAYKWCRCDLNEDAEYGLFWLPLSPRGDALRQSLMSYPVPADAICRYWNEMTAERLCWECLNRRIDGFSDALESSISYL